jgi:hypothetical protein
VNYVRASRGLSCLRGTWRLWRWMRELLGGKGTISLLDCSAKNAPNTDLYLYFYPKVHYHIHKCLPPVSILSQLDLVHPPISHILKSILLLFFNLGLGLPSYLFPLVFSTKTLYKLSFHTCYIPCLSHSSLFDHPNNIGWGVLMINPFQSNFSANRILPSSYLFWAVKKLVDYF